MQNTTYDYNKNNKDWLDSITRGEKVVFDQRRKRLKTVTQKNTVRQSINIPFAAKLQGLTKKEYLTKMAKEGWLEGAALADAFIEGEEELE